MTDRGIIELYERFAGDFDRERSRGLGEKAWLDAFLARVQPGGTVLDIGCGMGEPIARYLIESGVSVTGLDSSPTMIAMCRERFPDAEWLVADMRSLSLGRRFDGLLAWDSLFHLTRESQRELFARLAAHAGAGAPLMFTSGTADGEAIGSWCGEPLYHASLDTAEYERLLARHGFTVRAYSADDAAIGGRTAWMATCGGGSS